LILVRIESPLLYFNVNYTYKIISSKIKEDQNTLKAVILDLSSTPYIDSSGARFIKKLYLDLNSKNISFYIAEAHSEVRDILRKEGVEDLFGHIGRRDSLNEVIAKTKKEKSVNL
jgi:anti-anti-sigma factor